MRIPHIKSILLALGALVVLAAAASPWIVSSYWRTRSDNPVRRGLARAGELGCFQCHGELGRGGIPNPGGDEDVPQWDGSVWMMYVENDADIRRYIEDGSHFKTSNSATHADEEDEQNHHGRIPMPAYGDIVSENDIGDLVAAFKVLAKMIRPESGTAAYAGYELAEQWRCFSCHGPAGSGGLPNPGSFTGFVPGWYGADFRELVRNRDEFNDWIREGSIQRLSSDPIANFFLRRQRTQMPPYREFTSEQLDNLWAYTQWLEETDGGHRGEISSW